MTRILRGAARRTSDEGGQAIVLLAVIIVVLIGAAAMTVDVGHGWWVKREVQRTTDAAALAAAQALPSAANATAAANAYFAKNPIGGAVNPTITVSMRCRPSEPGCNPYNAVDVTVNATMNTSFARVFGINSLSVKAQATACKPCSWRDADIMVLQDRTGSMGSTTSLEPWLKAQGLSTSSVDDGMANSITGLQALLGDLNPAYDRVGLAVLPPVTSTSTICQPATGWTAWSGTWNSQSYSFPAEGYDFNYDDPTASYIAAPLESTYQNADGTLNGADPLVNDVRCLKASGGTSHADAIDAVVNYLNANARPDATKVIIFLTDGAANTAVAGDPSSTQTNPCGAAVAEAQKAATEGITFYTIAYNSSSAGNCTSDSISANTQVIQPNNPSRTSLASGYAKGTSLIMCAAAGTDSGGAYYDDPTDAPASNKCATSASPDGTVPWPYSHGGGRTEPDGLTPVTELQQMASNPADFFNLPTPGSLATDFNQIAADIGDEALIPYGG